MNKLQLAQDKLDVKRRELAEIFEAAGPDLTMTAEQVDEVKQRNTEIEEVARTVETLREAVRIEESNRKALEDGNRVVPPVAHGGAGVGAGAGGDQPAPQRKSVGELFVESPAFKQYNASNHSGPIVEIAQDVETKTLLSEGAGFAPQAIRTGVVVDSAQQQPKMVDIIPATTTEMIAVVFMRETTFTNAAAETAEGGLYPEAALQYTETSSPVRKIAVFLPVTDEQLGDIKGMAARINNRLLLMLRQRVDLQVLVGNGTAPNLTGLLNTSGILTQARGTDVNVDACYKALTQIRYTGFADPSAFVFNPTDWQNIRLLRTADGLYIFGNPSDPGIERLWGLPVVQTTYMTQGDALTADFQGYTELSYRMGIEFEVSNSHSDFFQRGQLAIRAQLRAALVVYRASALCEVTGL